MNGTYTINYQRRFVIMEWKPLQSIAKGFVLTDLLRPEFIEYLEEHFKD